MGSYFYGAKEEDETETLFQYEKFKNSFFLTSPYTTINLNSSFIITQTKEEFLNNYNQIDILDRNTNTKVIQVSDRKFRLNKVIKTTKILDEKYYNDCLNEIEALKNIDHPKIIKIFQYNIKENKSIDILIEYLNGPNLFSKLAQMNHFNEKDTLIIMYQLFSCIKFIHDNGIAHRDIKPENIIVVDDKNLSIKLIDFSSCEIFSELKQETNRRIGTPSYVSPEVINGENYSYECDIWSLGVLMFFLLSGKLPFDGITPNDIFNSIKNKKISFNEKIWNDVSLEAKNLIKCMLIKDKNKRININQILDSSWVSNGLIKYNIKSTLHNKDYCLSNLKNNLKKMIESQINQLQLLCLFYIIHNFIDFNNNPEVKFLTNEFIYYDKDNDGKLSENELNIFFTDISMEISDVQSITKIFEIFGKNRGNFLYYENFIILGLSNKNKLFNNDYIIKNFFKIVTKREFDILNMKDNAFFYNDIKNLFFEQNEKKYVNEEFDKFMDEISIKANEPLSYEKFKKSLLDLNI